MAGDWIKMRDDLLDDPAVFRIAAAVKLDKFSVIGRLQVFWSWVGKHAVDGCVDAGTELLVDDIVRCDGFAAALVAAMWLSISERGLEIPKHDRHNGNSAKKRAMKNARQARWRDGSDDDVDADASTEATTREEKRREEKSKPRSKAESAPAARLPADWSPSPDDIEFCKTTRPDLDHDVVRDRFRDYWVAQPGVKGRKADWPATWRNWVRNEKGTQARAPSGTRPKFDPTAHVNRNRNRPSP
ncbi:MAG: hypothetical protein V4631_21090 [Pseudomonadota bacterium]